jgi:Fe-S cluster assembly protein SufB
VAVDAIFDSVSVATTYRDKLAEQGIIFCSFGEAIHDHPELVKQYLGTVVPGNDNFFAALNAAVASDGTFIYVPKGVRCPMELSTYFRINAEKPGSLNAPFWSRMRAATSAISKAVRLRCATATSCMRRW